MMLNYKGTVIHDGKCACCFDRRGMQDAAASKADPTGTVRIRRAMKADFMLRWRSMRTLLRQMIVKNDFFGLSPLSLTNAMQSRAVGDASKIQGFQVWFDNVLKQKVLEGDGAYLRTYIRQGYIKGEAFGAEQIDLIGHSANYSQHERVELLFALTVVELQGVIEAVSQQVIRNVTNSLMFKATPRQMLRDTMRVINTIGGNRTNAIVEFMVVKAFSDGSLDLYEAAGVEEVGLIPESRPPRFTSDAAKIRSVKKRKRKVSQQAQRAKQAQRKAQQRAIRPNSTGAGSRISRAVAPSRRTVQRIRKEQEKLELLKLVNVRTAGDDDVCFICEDISEEGPYTINTARSLIPAHPNCRCVFVPARDKRFARTDDSRSVAA